MPSFMALVRAVRRALPDIKRGSLSIFGDVYGGRIDNIHIVIGASANPDGSEVVHFNTGERLTVWSASDVEVSASRFRIKAADRVRWEWYYYGREQTPDNLCFIEHRLEDARVAVTEGVR